MNCEGCMPFFLSAFIVQLKYIIQLACPVNVLAVSTYMWNHVHYTRSIGSADPHRVVLRDCVSVYSQSIIDDQVNINFQNEVIKALLVTEKYTMVVRMLVQ